MGEGVPSLFDVSEQFRPTREHLFADVAAELLLIEEILPAILLLLELLRAPFIFLGHRLLRLLVCGWLFDLRQLVVAPGGILAFLILFLVFLLFLFCLFLFFLHDLFGFLELGLSLLHLLTLLLLLFLFLFSQHSESVGGRGAVIGVTRAVCLVLLRILLFACVFGLLGLLIILYFVVLNSWLFVGCLRLLIIL